MLSALLPLPLLLLIVATRPAHKWAVLLLGLLASTAGVSARQLPGTCTGFHGGEPKLIVMGGTELKEIPPSDFAPELLDGTYFPPQVTGEILTHSFSLVNMGTSEPLNITAITLTGRSAAFFSCEAVLVEGRPHSMPLSLAPGQQAIITVRYEAATVGKHTATITIHNNDEDEGLFAFMLQASTIPDMIQPDEPAPLLNGIASATSPQMP